MAVELYGRWMPGVRFKVEPDANDVPAANLVLVVLEGTAGGRFHIGGAERLSRYELGQRVAQVLGLRGHFERVSQATLAVRRPADASLDSGRARRELGWTPRPLDEAIRDGRRPAV